MGVERLVGWLVGLVVVAHVSEIGCWILVELYKYGKALRGVQGVKKSTRVMSSSERQP